MPLPNGCIPTNFHGQVITLDASGRDQIVEGLYAAGECACVSVHGANRLGTNSLLDLVVFGRAVGLKLEDELAKGLGHRDEDKADVDRAMGRVERWNNPNNTEDPYEIRTRLRQIMQDSFAVFRDKEPMEKSMQELEELNERLQRAKLGDVSTTFNTTRIEMLELDNLMETALTTARSALHRTESRGAHYRFDCLKGMMMSGLSTLLFSAMVLFLIEKSICSQSTLIRYQSRLESTKGVCDV